MSMESENKQISPRKKALRKKGGIYLVIFVICLSVAIIMFNAGVQGGIIYGLVNLVFVVFFILAVITLIRGYTGK